MIVTPLDYDANDHSTHHALNSVTLEEVEEASVVVDGRRIYWCGHSELVADGD